jgi:hypothetical protein
MRLQVKVTASTLRIRKQATTSSAVAGHLNKGDLVTVIKEQNGFYYLSDARGWIGKSYTTVVKNLETSKQPSKVDNKKGIIDPKTKAAETAKQSPGIDKKLINMLYEAAKNKPGNITPSTRLFGSPHQFNPLADFRIGTEEYGLGRKYTEANITEAPIVYFLPGKPSYLPDSSADERSAVSSYLLGNKNDDNGSILDQFIGNKDFRYFSFLTDYAGYMRYVNILCRFCAIYMGLGDLTAPKSSTPYRSYNWSNYRFDALYKQSLPTENSTFNMKEIATSAYESMFGNYQYVQFYVDPSTSFSESSSNSTSQSKLAGMFDSAQGIVKELAFLLDASAISRQSSALQTFASGVEEIKSKLGGNDNFFQRLLGMSSTILDGSNIIFPEIWGDAAYNKSYNVTVNLVSPYGDKESIYLNIMVPLMHLLALSLPRQTTANSYSSPFLIKAFAKGWFSCQMGIIDSISIDKGSNNSWSVHGLPTEVKVQLGIKDLYGNMSISPSNKPSLFLNNPGLVEFLAVTCGIDISRPEFQTKLTAIFAMLLNSVTDIPANAYNDFLQKIRRSIDGLYKF